MSAGPCGSAARAIAPQPTPRHAHAAMVLMITCTPCGKERAHCSLCLNQGSCIGATGAANDGGAAVPAVTLTELILQREDVRLFATNLASRRRTHEWSASGRKFAARCAWGAI